MSNLSPIPLAPAHTHPHVEPAQRAGLQILHDADTQATRLGYDPWDFAVELDELLRHGLTRTDVRVLIALGLVEHGCERRRTKNRRFHPREGLRLSRRSCFVLTELGRDAAARLPGSPPL